MIAKGTTFILMILLLTACKKTEDQIKEEKAIYNECVSNGVRYFREIGSFPTLKTAPNKGRHAITVARERCERAPQTAFSS